jgi:hypothetical protein
MEPPLEDLSNQITVREEPARLATKSGSGVTTKSLFAGSS